MESLYTMFQSLDSVVIFIVVISGIINKYAFIKHKFLIPVLVSAACAAYLGHADPETDSVRLWFTYSGQSSILYEIYKHYIKKLVRTTND